MQRYKSIGTLQDKNLQMLWPALSPSTVKACVDWLCTERGKRKEKNFHTGLLLLEKAKYSSHYLCAPYLEYSFLLAYAPNANISVAHRFHVALIFGVSDLCYKLLSLQFFLLASELQQGVPKELLLPKCGIGIKPLNLRFTLYIRLPFPLQRVHTAVPLCAK